jgi:hypothetical protein
MEKHERGFFLERRDGNRREKVDAGAIRLAVDPKGHPWIVTLQGLIFRLEEGKWHEMPGKASDISIGADGAVWMLGAEEKGGAFPIWHWSGKEWRRVEGVAKRIAVGPQGRPWIIDAEGRIFHRE